MSIDFNAIYADTVAALAASGLNVSSLTKGDETLTYRGSEDLIALLNYLKSQGGAQTAQIKTVARNVRTTI